MLAWHLLWRNWRSGEIKLLAVALALAVTVVSAIALFTDRLEGTLLEQSNSLLGADRLVKSNQAHKKEWEVQAERDDVSYSRVAHFSSMIFAGDEMHLAAVKAVANNYPLRGYIDVSTTPFATDPALIERAQGVPAPGEIWVDSRLLPLLHIELGESLQVGEHELVATKVVVSEPDGSGPFSMMGARIIMNWEDLAKTRVIQPGSRVEYQWLLAGSSSDMNAFMSWLEPQLSDHDEVMDIENAQRRLQGTLQTGRRFLVLAAIMGVLLAGVAIALAARQFAERHVNQVALLKSLGTSSQRIRQLYLVQLLLLATVASLLGLAVGAGLQALIAQIVHNIYQVTMAKATITPFILSLLSGPLALVGFALPSLWFLPKVPPIKVLRQELSVSKGAVGWQIAMASLVLVILVGVFGRDLTLGVTVLAALAVVGVLTGGMAFGLLAVGKKAGAQAGSRWRLAWASIQRRRGASVLQVVVFATAIMLLLTLTIVRTSLIEEWQVKVPENAPNHFLINVAPSEVDDFKQLLADDELKVEPLFPMVRGRLTHIDGEPKPEDTLNREASLTWTGELSEDNEVVAGQWWDTWQRSQLPGVSVEHEVAERLGIELGSQLTFSIGGLIAQAEVASFRSLQWESLRPNFYFIFEPGALDDYAPMYMTSVYLPPEKKQFINTLLTRYPTIVVLELDRIINQIRDIVAQVSDGVGLVLLMVLLGGCLVLIAAVTGSIDARKQEAGLLRALGAPRRLLVGSIWIEFALLGFCAGFIAVVASEALLLGLQVYVFRVPVQPHYFYWLATPIAGALFVSSLGAISCRHSVTTPPATVLREAL
ncbi:FtsX-like permease family protein [Gilvimarinus sp. SDUM040013]|uniref:FtsX-like permease family protein n=1 Tax=Gilvimarinus gilvus TaxID=3058038 RepID=A0ABU4RT86_9GAMM|nr:FtsX-like permease family protein [Gilvimarinus sp. SDUM040013]MDO3387007.1 FtsX-like permease family protein [Gilvimarinus sp. SDUM040013]MDX6848099.1 FtsX-like permease family protein [Gilvimarinus sp. SDUM040013]